MPMYNLATATCDASILKILLVTGTALALVFPAYAAGSRELHFRSPTGNIQCRGNAASVTCLLRTNTWPRLRHRPANCDVDWFPTDVSLYVKRSTGRWAVQVGGCRGDVGPACYATEPCRVLRYGQSIQSVANGSGIRCTSTRAAVTCRKLGARAGAHGFRMSREDYTIF